VRFRNGFWAALAAVFASAGVAAAAAEEDEAALLALLAGDDAVALAPALLAEVPRETLEQVLAGLRDQIGPVEDIVPAGEDYQIETASHLVRARIALDGEGRVAMLWFDAPEPRVSGLAEAEALLAGLGRETAWLALRDGEVLAARESDVPLAVGSAFKIGVLSVLAEDVAAGRRDWADVVRLAPGHRSLPTGRMQDFPEGAPVTLHSAALAMIAESDNTATDLLVDTLGAARVAARLGIAPEDFLTTRAFFGLKADAALREAWLAAPAAERPALAARAAERLPPPAQVGGPFVPGVEWTLPLDRLCALGAPLAALPLMQVNPGPVTPDPALWQRIAYKGGSEPGVLNVTALMRDLRGRDWCVALTVNDGAEIPLPEAMADFGAFLRALTALP